MGDSILKTIFAHVGDESGLIVSELKDEQAVACSLPTDKFCAIINNPAKIMGPYRL